MHERTNQMTESPLYLMSDNDLIAGLDAWQLGTIVSVRRHGRSLNSATWMVTADTGVWIVKAVPATGAAQFNAGLAVAAHLEAAGLRAGAPRVTRMGDLSMAMVDAQVAVLPFIAGRAIDPTNPGEQQLWGATLGRAHCILRGAARPAGVMEWHWVDTMAGPSGRATVGPPGRPGGGRRGERSATAHAVEDRAAARRCGAQRGPPRRLWPGGDHRLGRGDLGTSPL